MYDFDNTITSYRISTVGKVKAYQPINVHEQRIVKFTRREHFRFVCSPRIATLGDCFKIRGFFMPHHLIDEKATVTISIGGRPISEIPLKLLMRLNTRNDISDLNYIDFSYDVFFSDPIYLHLLQYHEVWLHFKNIHPEINEIDVVFDATWLDESERKVDNGIKSTLMKNICTHMCGIVQNVLICDKKSNISGIEITADILKDTHKVLDYDERLVGIYGVAINDGVTCFNMNPLVDWKSHVPTGGFHNYAHVSSHLTLKKKEERNADIYYLVTNSLYYENGMGTVRFSWL